MLVRALETLNPSIVLIEGPPEATAGVMAFAADPSMTPPVALLVYEVEAPTRAVYYPFAHLLAGVAGAALGARQERAGPLHRSA